MSHLTSTVAQRAQHEHLKEKTLHIDLMSAPFQVPQETKVTWIADN